MELRAFMLIVQLVSEKKGGKNEWFKIESGLRQKCIMSPWLFNVYMDGVMKEVKMRMRRRRVSLLDDWRK